MMGPWGKVLCVGVGVVLGGVARAQPPPCETRPLPALPLVNKTLITVLDNYGGDRPDANALFLSAARRLAASYPMLTLPPPREVNAAWKAANELRVLARHARCALSLPDDDPGPERAMAAGILEGLPWSGGALYVFRPDRTPDPRYHAEQPQPTSDAPRPAGDAPYALRTDAAILHARVIGMRAGFATKLRAAARAAEVRGVVLDLRGSGGGLLAEVERSADVFLRRGTIYSLRSRFALKATSATDTPEDVDLPVVVLVDRATRSGAEALTAALQENDRALVVGEHTAGSAIVNAEFTSDDRTVIAVPTAELVTPRGGALNGAGVTADVEASGPDAPLALALSILAKTRGASRAALRDAAAR